MGESPVAGALLQLKETGTNEANSKRGLGMPRVKLTNETNLFPMFATDPNADVQTANTLYDSPAEKIDQDDLHIGLTVYNTNQCFDHAGGGNGIHVWDGAKWQPIKKWNGSTVKGRSGKMYKTAKFGNMEWMIENLEETIYDTQAEVSGSLSPGRRGATFSGSIISEHLKAYYFPTNPSDLNYGQYQNPDPAATPTVSDIAHDRRYYDDHKQYGVGLFYSWAAATADRYSSPIVLSTQAPPANAYSTVQGICPNGWRIPSERDWLDLEKEIADHRDEYSTGNPNTTAWNTSYETGDASNSSSDQFHRGTHATSMKSPCPVAGSTESNTGGYSKPNGLNVLLIGYIGTNHLEDYFGTFTAFFTSSQYQQDPGSIADTANAWGRAIGNTGNGVRRDRQGIDQLQPIRCVKARN